MMIRDIAGPQKTTVLHLTAKSTSAPAVTLTSLLMVPPPATMPAASLVISPMAAGASASA